LQRVHAGAASARLARRPGCLERCRPGDDAGFGLIEVLVPLTVLTVVRLTVERGTIATLSAESLAKEHSVAIDQVRDIQRTIPGKTSGADADHLTSIMRGLPPLTCVLYSNQFPRFIRVALTPQPGASALTLRPEPASFARSSGAAMTCSQDAPESGPRPDHRLSFITRGTAQVGLGISTVGAQPGRWRSDGAIGNVLARHRWHGVVPDTFVRAHRTRRGRREAHHRNSHRGRLSHRHHRVSNLRAQQSTEPRTRGGVG